MEAVGFGRKLAGTAKQATPQQPWFEIPSRKPSNLPNSITWAKIAISRLCFITEDTFAPAKCRSRVFAAYRGLPGHHTAGSSRLAQNKGRKSAFSEFQTYLLLFKLRNPQEQLCGTPGGASAWIFGLQGRLLPSRGPFAPDGGASSAIAALPRSFAAPIWRVGDAWQVWGGVWCLERGKSGERSGNHPPQLRFDPSTR